MNKILSPKEQLQVEHTFRLQESTRMKLKSSFLRVWDSRFVIAKLRLNKDSILYEGVNYYVRSSFSKNEMATQKMLGLSFRVLDSGIGYVIIKPWDINPHSDSRKE